MAASWYARAATALVAALALMAGCGLGDDGDTPEPTPTPSPTSPPPGSPRSPTAPATPPADGGDDTVREDVEAAVRVTDAYWSKHWGDLFTGSYQPPRLLGAYDGATPPVPGCAGEALPDDNAVYCPAGDYVAWDLDLMSRGHQAGDAWVYLVIAHEWGHAIQQRLSAELVSRAAELQADCLAGAALFGAERDGTLRFEEGDTQELNQALTALADETPWTDTTDHGDAGERIAAFDKGARSGVTACLPEDALR
ncbi:neutral zinc metallopeptidase [Streptomyces sp. NPDC018031]|uniref:neutral zinc metallopeptidase n=1 Tax=Streptomyces sp. NPDC018031 TaxID=3365033 RepID=UPI003795787E